MDTPNVNTNAYAVCAHTSYRLKNFVCPLEVTPRLLQNVYLGSAFYFLLVFNVFFPTTVKSDEEFCLLIEQVVRIAGEASKRAVVYSEAGVGVCSGRQSAGNDAMYPTNVLG